MTKKTAPHVLNALGAAYCGGNVDAVNDYESIDALINALNNGGVQQQYASNVKTR